MNDGASFSPLDVNSKRNFVGELLWFSMKKSTRFYNSTMCCRFPASALVLSCVVVVISSEALVFAIPLVVPQTFQSQIYALTRRTPMLPVRRLRGKWCASADAADYKVQAYLSYVTRISRFKSVLCYTSESMYFGISFHTHVIRQRWHGPYKTSLAFVYQQPIMRSTLRTPQSNSQKNLQKYSIRLICLMQLFSSPNSIVEEPS